MNEQTFLKSLGFSEQAPDIDHVERKFLEEIKDRISSVLESYDAEEVKLSEEWLRTRHTEFFQYSLLWANTERLKHTATPNHAEAVDLKKQARAVLENLQENIIGFATCYMHIDRYMTIVRDELKEQEVRLSVYTPQGTKWTSDAGELIARYKKRKVQIREQEDKIAKSTAALNDIDMGLETMRRSMNDLFGKDKTNLLMRKFISSLRTADFVKTGKAINDIKQTKKKFTLDQKTTEDDLKALLLTISNVVELVVANKKNLEGNEKKLYLRPQEVLIVQRANASEVNKINLFLAKYQLPYMQYKLNTLVHLREKLFIIGSLESLLTLYKALISGIARPLPDVRTIREYENQVIDKVVYLLNGQFQELSNIVNRADEVVKEYRQSRNEFDEIENLIQKMEDVDHGGDHEQSGKAQS